MYENLEYVRSSIRLIQRVTIKVMSIRCQLDYVWLEQYNVPKWVTICTQTNDEYIRVWREEDTCHRPQNITKHYAFRGESIVVWARVSLGYRTDLHTFCAGFCDDCSISRGCAKLECEILRCSSWSFYRLMENKARFHRAVIVPREWRDCAWGAGLNPIENLLDAFGRAGVKRPNHSQDLQTGL